MIEVFVFVAMVTVDHVTKFRHFSQVVRDLFRDVTCQISINSDENTAFYGHFNICENNFRDPPAIHPPTAN